MPKTAIYKAEVMLSRENMTCIILIPYLKVQCSTHGKFGKGVILRKQPDSFVNMIVWRCPFQNLILRQFVSQFLFYVVQGVPNVQS